MTNKKQFLVNFMIRVIFGFGLIFFANQFFVHQEIPLKVGFNAVSMIVSGVLGVPGVAMLYGIVAIPIL